MMVSTEILFILAAVGPCIQKDDARKKEWTFRRIAALIFFCMMVASVPGLAFLSRAIWNASVADVYHQCHTECAQVYALEEHAKSEKHGKNSLEHSLSHE